MLAEGRLAAVRQLHADESVPAALQGLVEVACRLLGAPSGQVSLLSEVQLVAAGTGAAAASVGTTGPLDDSLCTLTAADREPLALSDARLDPRAAALGPVTGGTVRAYLGVPLHDADGEVLGSLCVFAPEPRDWAPGDVATLELLARAVVNELTIAGRMVDAEAERLRWTLAVDAAGVGSFDYDPVSGQLAWDARLQELFGYTEGEFDSTLDAFNARLHPDDVERVAQAIEATVRGDGDLDVEYRVLLPDGSARWLQGRGKTLRDENGTGVRLLGAAYDTTDVHEPRTSRLLEAMPSGFLSLDTEWRFTVLNTAAERLLGHHRDELLGRTIWEAFPGTVGNEFEEAYRTAVATRTPRTIEAFYPAPLNTWYEVLCWPTPDGLSLYFSDITARKAAAAEAQAASARLALLAEVNSALLAADDVPAEVAALPRRLVPLLADTCFVTLLQDDGRPLDVGSWHADPARREALEQYVARRLDAMPTGSPVARVLATGQPVRSDADEILALLAPGPVRELFDELASREGLALPIHGRGRLVGVLSLFSDAGRARGADDEATAQEIAYRIGLALENARMARAQSQIAEGLQRNLLTPPPERDRVQIVVRYVPASESARVGGDWYDAFPQPGGSTMLVIGDVVGHDVEAAAAMGQLRSLLRGIATYGGDGPAEVLHGLDASMDLLGTRTLATAAVARLDTGDDGATRLVWANAGHLPPLVLHADGRTEFLAGGRPDLLLGVEPGARRTEHVRVLAEGSTVLLYTDGLVERRSSDLDAGLQRLRAAVGDLAGSTLDELCDGVIERLVEGRPEDDVALVAIRLHGPGMAGRPAGHSSPVREMDPKDPSTLYSEGPVAAEPPDDDVPETSPVPDSGGVGPGPDDLD
ncbi:histidine kinase [Blastococcus sp. TF02-09]|nr:histidine kinase [Blastococcus sp. TF02-9]